MVISEQTNVTASARVELNLPIEPTNLTGYLTTADGYAVAGMDVVLTDTSTGYEFTTTSGDGGDYSFDYLMPSKYQMTIASDDQMLFSQYLSLTAGLDTTRNATVYDTSHARCKVSFEGSSVAYAAYRITDVYDPDLSVSGTADAYGWVEVDLPEGSWTIYSWFSDGTGVKAGALSISTSAGETASGTVVVSEAFEVSGTLKSPRGARP
jgi:hypothetical protein